MRSLIIRARFPLGVFQGHQSDKSPAQYPATSRLFSALMHGAGKGSEAVERDGDLRPSSQSMSALRWLEAHPPESLTLPETSPVTRRNTRADAWRAEGVFDEKNLDKKSLRQVGSGRAVNGIFAWHWPDAPKDVIDQIERICPDVSCLGEADSPVILDVGDAEPTHHIDKTASKLRPSRNAVPVLTPQEGRVNVLETAYEAEHPKKRAKDRLSHSMRLTEVPRTGLVEQSYVPVVAPATTRGPWEQVYLLAADTTISPSERVTWCVTFHRTLVKTLGDLAPSMVTGRYAKGVALPANRLAIHWLPKAHMETAGVPVEHGGFAIMLPAGADPDDVMRVENAVQRVSLYRGRRGIVTAEFVAQVDAATFWPKPQAGWRRRWRPLNALVPESYAQPEHPELGSWTFSAAAELSLAHVFRDDLPSSAGPRYWGRVRQARDAGVKISDVHRMADTHVDRYAHKVPDGLGVVQPYTATIDLGTFGSDSMLIAVGQSRHLGGGLLVPVDDIEDR